MTDKNTAALFGGRMLGLGCMRLPQKDGEMDIAALSEMVDAFLAEGFTYFDTAHGYHGGKSETALRAALTSRHPRESYILTNKLSTYHFERREEIRPLFESQLRACGVDYFDFYLMHAQDETLYRKYRAAHAYETALALKEEGKFRHFGISFHGTPSLLREILTAYPEIEAVQLQLNYRDYEDPAVASRRCLEVAREFGKPCIVMEPVKGGNLVNLPKEAEAAVLAAGTTPAALALRFAAEPRGVALVLSGMGNMAMLRENMETLSAPRPLTEEEREAVTQVRAILAAAGGIPCTACEYCLAGCPQAIPIPRLFATANTKTIFGGWNAAYYYGVHTKNGGRASSCIGCGACEAVCPQHLPIRDLLKTVAATFEKDED